MAIRSLAMLHRGPVGAAFSSAPRYKLEIPLGGIRVNCAESKLQQHPLLSLPVGKGCTSALLRGAVSFGSSSSFPPLQRRTSSCPSRQDGSNGSASKLVATWAHSGLLQMKEEVLLKGTPGPYFSARVRRAAARQGWQRRFSDGSGQGKWEPEAGPTHLCSAAASSPETEPEPAVPPREKAEGGGLLTLPTALTLVRVAAVPALVAVFYSSPEAATVIFVLASVTDWLDGYLARKMGSITAFGAFLDPVADKLMVAAALVLLCTQPLPLPLPLWGMPTPAIAIVGREIAMSAVREWAAAQGGDLHQAVAVSWMGKWKTATQMAALTLLLAARHPGLEGAPMAAGAGMVLLYTSAGLALASLGQYLRAIWGPLMKSSP